MDLQGQSRNQLLQGISDAELCLLPSDSRSLSHQICSPIGSITWDLFHRSALRQSNTYPSYHQQIAPEGDLWYLCWYQSSPLFVCIVIFLFHPSVKKRDSWWAGQGLPQKLLCCSKVHELIWAGFLLFPLFMKVFVLKKTFLVIFFFIMLFCDKILVWCYFDIFS